MTHFPQSVKAVLFDWDNTLVDSWPVLYEALQTTYIVMGKTPLSMDQIRSQTAHSLRDRFPVVFGDQWREAQTVFYQEYRKAKIHGIQALPYAEDLLVFLRRQGAYLAIVSNKLGEELRKEVDALGWTPYFKQIIGSGDCPEDKPSPLCVDAALSEEGRSYSRQDVWFVGDTKVDYECARNAGCFPVLVHPLEECNTAVTVAGCGELLAYAKRIYLEGVNSEKGYL